MLFKGTFTSQSDAQTWAASFDSSVYDSTPGVGRIALWADVSTKTFGMEAAGLDNGGSSFSASSEAFQFSTLADVSFSDEDIVFKDQNDDTIATLSDIKSTLDISTLESSLSDLTSTVNSIDIKAKGFYASESALLADYANGADGLTSGSYAFVSVTETDSDGNETTSYHRYTYDGSTWSDSGSISGDSLTGADIKELYESQEDTNAFTDDEQSKLAAIEEGAQVNTVETVNGVAPDADKDVTLTAEDLGLDNVVTLSSLKSDSYSWIRHTKTLAGKTFFLDPEEYIKMIVSSDAKGYYLELGDNYPGEYMNVVSAGNALNLYSLRGYINSQEWGNDIVLEHDVPKGGLTEKHRPGQGTGTDFSYDYFIETQTRAPFQNGFFGENSVQKNTNCWVGIWDKSLGRSIYLQIIGLTANRFMLRFHYTNDLDTLETAIVEPPTFMCREEADIAYEQAANETVFTFSAVSVTGSSLTYTFTPDSDSEDYLTVDLDDNTLYLNDDYETIVLAGLTELSGTLTVTDAADNEVSQDVTLYLLDEDGNRLSDETTTVEA